MFIEAEESYSLPAGALPYVITLHLVLYTLEGTSLASDISEKF